MKPNHKKLPGKIAAEKSQSIRQEIARYGRTIPGVGFVATWRKRWQATHDKKTGQMPLAEFEREALLGKFMWPLIALDAAFFREIADAIDAFKASPVPESALYDKLNDLALWIQAPHLTVREIAGRVNYSGDLDTFRRILRKLGVPHKKDKVGRRKNSDR